MMENIPTGWLREPIVAENRQATAGFMRWLRTVLAKTDNSLTLKGEIKAPIQGRTEPITQTLQNVDVDGTITERGIDFSRAYLNKQQDNIPDGATYGRVLNLALTNGGVDLSKNGVVGHLGSTKITENVMNNYSNNATVDSTDNGVNATIRVYGPGGVGTTWHQFIGSTIGPEIPAFSGAFNYATNYNIYYDDTGYHVTTLGSETLPDGIKFSGSLKTVASGGGGGTIGGGGPGGGGGGGGQRYNQV